MGAVQFRGARSGPGLIHRDSRWRPPLVHHGRDGARAHAQSSPQVIRDFVAGLAEASQYTRKHRDEAVEIFAKWVPGLDVAVGKKAIQHISYDPRVSRPVMQAFEAAEDDVLKNTLKGAARLNIPDQFASSYLADVEKTNPEYFSDLPALPR